MTEPGSPTCVSVPVALSFISSVTLGYINGCFRPVTSIVGLNGARGSSEPGTVCIHNGCDVKVVSLCLSIP